MRIFIRLLGIIIIRGPVMVPLGAMDAANILTRQIVEHGGEEAVVSTGASFEEQAAEDARDLIKIREETPNISEEAAAEKLYALKIERATSAPPAPERTGHLAPTKELTAAQEAEMTVQEAVQAQETALARLTQARKQLKNPKLTRWERPAAESELLYAQRTAREAAVATEVAHAEKDAVQALAAQKEAAKNLATAQEAHVGVNDAQQLLEKATEEVQATTQLLDEARDAVYAEKAANNAARELRSAQRALDDAPQQPYKTTAEKAAALKKARDQVESAQKIVNSAQELGRAHKAARKAVDAQRASAQELKKSQAELNKVNQKKDRKLYKKRLGALRKAEETEHARALEAERTAELAQSKKDLYERTAQQHKYLLQTGKSRKIEKIE